MEKLLNTGRITKAVESKLASRKADCVYSYTNYLDWLGYMKDEAEFTKFEKMLEKICDNWLLKPMEKLDMLNFFYPIFERKVASVRAYRASKNKKLNFQCKSLLNIIWGC